jgi:hypothetical protein
MCVFKFCLFCLHPKGIYYLYKQQNIFLGYYLGEITYPELIGIWYGKYVTFGQT